VVAKDLEWINSVYFTRLTLWYRALGNGYINGVPQAKLLAAFKDIIQSISPCRYSRENDCEKCTFKELCCFYFLVEKNKNGVDYRPYIVRTNDNNEWFGVIQKDNIYCFELILIGHAVALINDIEKGVRLKKILSIYGRDDVNFGFESFIVNSPPNNAHGLYERLLQNRDSAYKKIKNITLDFVTNFKHQYKSQIRRDPKDMSFEMLMDALYKRASGLAKDHCGFSGTMPDLDTFMSGLPPVKTHFM